MTKFFAVIFAVGVSLAAVSAADAAGGCGAGWHRGPHGGCLRITIIPAGMLARAVIISDVTAIAAPTTDPLQQRQSGA